MGLDDKRKKIGSVLALSAMAPGTIIGTGVNTVSANDDAVKTSDTLKNFLNRNHLGWIWSAISYVLVRFGYSTDITIRRVDNNNNNVNNLDNYEADKKLGDDRIVENKNEDNDNHLQNKVEAVRKKLFEKATISIAYKLFGFDYKTKNFIDEKDDIKKYGKEISELSKNFEDSLYVNENESYETSWPSEKKKVFNENLSIIEWLYENYSKDEIKHLKKLCKFVELGDKTANNKIEYENSDEGKKLAGCGWALTKAKLCFRIEACIELIRKRLDSLKVEDTNKLINKLSDSLPGQFNNQEIDKIYYGKIENSLIDTIRTLATYVEEKDYSIYKNKNIIDGETLNLIRKVENEINRNNNDEIVNNEKIIYPLYDNFGNNENNQYEYPSLEEIESYYRENLFSNAIYSAVYDLFGHSYEPNFANDNEKKELELYSKRVSETSKNFENLIAVPNYKGYEKSWPGALKDAFHNNCEFLSSYYSGPEVEHLEKLCKYVEMEDELADKLIKSNESAVEKEVIGRGWALTKAKLYFRIKSCINTIREKLPNNLEEKNELIKNLENSLPGKFNNDSIEGIYYGNTENNLINRIYSLAYNFNENEKDYDIYKDEKLIDKETLKITNNDLNTNKNFYNINEIDNNGNVNFVDINKI